ncbi:DUF5926 family protein [Mobilicoccus massiliensis]|uniref:DUF5926 family protein n=1 Tax=Mobilicoccus massiliensis TaxID=1522310 RepID=UPI00058C79B2|nr:DUF5926 family protein [Mobilicoccus massiliensis]
MGKASRRARQAERRQGSTVSTAAPFVARPFEGVPGETDIVAMREIVPAATARLRLRRDAAPLVEAAGDGEVPEFVTLATVLPLAWPGLHRGDGEYLIGLQSGSSTGDHSRDAAHVLLELMRTPEGQPARPAGIAERSTPRLQELVDLDAPFEVEMHETFDFWIAPGRELDAEAQASLEQTNASIVPTRRLSSIESAYWCRVGERTHLRWLLPQNEDEATNALARLVAAGDVSLGPDTRLLGAFRACGLLAPVWDLDPALEADDYEDAAAAVARRFAEALAVDTPLNADERRARSGLLGRQLTLR